MKKLVWLVLFTLMIISCNDKDAADKQRFLIRGNNALAKQEYKEALRLYTEALKIDSCYTDALNNIGIVQYENGRYSEAVLSYDAALQCDLESWEAYANRANAYYELNELYRALDDLEYLERKIPDSSSVHFGLGLVKTKMRKYDEAIIAFDRAADLDTTNAEVLVNRGTVYYYKEEFGKAETDLLLAMRIDPKEANAFNAMALLRVDQGRYDDALRNVEEALRLEAFQPYFLNNRGYIKLQLGKEDAVEDINKSIVIDPQNGWAYRNKALWHMKSKRYQQALELLTRAEQLDDFIDQLYYYKGMCLYELDKTSEACAVWTKSLERGEKRTEVELKQYCNG